MAARTPGNGNRFLDRPGALSEGARTEVQELNQQQPPGDGNRFPGPPRKLVEQETQGERTPQDLPQVNKDRHDQGGGGSSRFQIRNNNITAGERASNVGIHNFGNTTPDRTCCIL